MTTSSVRARIGTTAVALAAVALAATLSSAQQPTSTMGGSENSVKELQQSTPGTATPDQIDLYILGVDYDNLNRFADAADAYNRCGQVAGPLQDRCKQSADAAKKQVPQSK